jgi:hypothetical protein
LFPRFFGITNTFRPFFSEPPELEALVELPPLELDAALDDEELLEDPHAARLTTATVSATARPSD